MYIPSRIADASNVLPPPPLPADYKPTVRIAELPASAPIEEILALLDRDGGLILTDLMSTEQLAKVEEETAQYTTPEGRIFGDGFGNLIPKQTTLVNGLVGKSDTMANLCEHPLLKELRLRVLTDYRVRTLEEIQEDTIVEPLLSVSMSFRVGYGAPRQRYGTGENISHPFWQFMRSY